MPHVKAAHPSTPIQPILADRWSPYGFTDREVADHDLLALFEAARWAPSSYNEQPWRYIVARRRDADEYARLLSCLVDGNQVWAKFAPGLAIGVAVLDFKRNGKPNKAAQHDLGLASANLSAEATARGLFVHQMIGIVPERVRELYAVPANAEPLTGLAVGYLGDGAGLPDEVRARDAAPRTRLALDEIVFSGRWSEPAALGK
jgi:nitroreductase